MEGVIKLLVASLSVESLIDPCLFLIGALSSHALGCNLISENGMLALFSQMFLSAGCGETSISLTILSNAAKNRAEIPQISLIVSCLMQDLMYTQTRKGLILATLRDLVSGAPMCVQEYDLQNSVMPLISTKQPPVVVVLALRLFLACDVSHLRGFYQVLCQRTYQVLAVESMLFPELVLAATNLIVSLAVTYDLSVFIKATRFVDFTRYVAAEIQSDFRPINQKLRDLLALLEASAN
jgi:hypothetical protein